MIEADRVVLLSGEPELVNTPSNSGKGQKIARCPNCHVALWSNYAGAGDAVRFVRVGTLDEPDCLPPDIHIFTSSKQPWVVLSPDAPAVAEYYERDKHWPKDSLERRHALLANLRSGPAVTFDAFIETAWSDHADHPQEVADRLAASFHLVQAPEHIPPFARLLTHVFGEHLGQWHRGVDLVESLRRLPAFDGGAAVAGALTRSIATLRYASGDKSALEALSNEDRVAALAAAASALTGRNEFGQALAAYSEAVRFANDGIPSDSPAVRALAIGGNNLAAALEEKNHRDAAETKGMVTAAESALKYWKLAGTWLEEERAEYRLTRSLLQAGEPDAALRSAERCVRVCKQNNAPALEQFFGYTVFALAQRAVGDAGSFEDSRARARQLYEDVPRDEEHWCASDLEDLEG